ncbi:MAG: D-aminoacyl-tRNA deacylase [Candidatus Omnitrophica bacterium]|nr:D-aminoacyl-tRNA deacylase [Candidatus Omnitrophota bacterium]
MDCYKGEIGKGIVLLVGFGKGDVEDKLDYFEKKIISLRIFEDENGKMNNSILDINGEIMIVPQFTLYGDCSKGNRPDFTKAEKPEVAKILFEKFVDKFKIYNIKIVEGEFGEKMLVEIHNDGPCSLILEK